MPDQLTAAEFLELTEPWGRRFVVEFIAGVPWISGQPVDAAAFRQAMRLLRTQPPAELISWPRPPSADRP